jgi:hypothetical protein
MAMWTNEKREQYFKDHPENFADPEIHKFPIEDASDVEDAAQLHGQSRKPEEIKRNIIAIAKRMKLQASLPDDWQQESGSDATKENDDTPEQEITEAIRLDGQICEMQSQPANDDQPGHELRVTVLQGGKSKNGYSYNASTLSKIAQMIEGAQAYADHARNSADLSVRSVRDVIGFYHSAKFITAAQNPQGDGNGRVDATLHIFEAASWLWSVVQEAVALGRPDLIGLSIDIMGQWQHNADTQSKDVTQIISLNSCDVVTRPSAGGAFRRILHSEEPPDTSLQTGDTTIMEPKNKKLETLPPVPGAAPSLPQAPAPPPSPVVPPAPAPNPEPVLIQEHQNNPAPTTSLEVATTPTPAPEITIDATATRITEQSALLQSLMDELRQERAAAYLERRLTESVLPDPVRNMVRARFNGRIFENRDIDAEINAQQDMLATLTAQGLIRGNGYEKPGITSMISEAEKIQAAFDRMFDLDIDTAKLGNIRGFGGILEAYRRVTGDASVQGGISGNSTLGQIRVTESAPITRISEADTTTASFSYLLGSSMNKRLLKDYQAWPAEWMKFCTVAPIRDFKQQVRVRFGAFGSLSTVPEDSAYTTVSLIDSAATYVAQKRGNIVSVSRETIINDDLMAIKQIPTKLAVAAAYTLAEFVYAFFVNNPTIYDGNALFTSGGGSHLNLGSTALSSAAMQTGVTAMREQTNYASKRIGLRPRFLIVPPELEFTAMVVTKSAGVPGSNNNDINPMLGYVTPIVSPQLTSTTQWFMACDPREIDTIELGFVGGQMNPALFVQDQPLTYANAA